MPGETREEPPETQVARLQDRVARLEADLAERTDQLRAAADSLQAGRRQYDELFNGMLDGFALHEIICDADGKPCDYRFLEANPAFEALTGLTAENIIGRTVLEVLPGTERHWIEAYGKVALTGEPAHFENYSQDLDRTYEVTAYSTGKGRFAVIFSDVTERKRAEMARLRFETQILHSQKLESLGLLAAGIAHDFNNLLVSILGNADLALDELTESSPARESLTDIETAARRAANLCRQLLAYSGKGRFIKKVVNLTDKLLRNVIIC